MNSRNAFCIAVRRREWQGLLSVLILLVWCSSVFGQSRQTKPVSQSELSRQNMAHVAADAQQLALILHRDPGLMVEVKRWIAKDATDHGQIITEVDLAEEVIFDRLENDITFRSVVTEIVQKYGYLVPALNPDSPLAKQQDLLIQERVKWISEEEAADREKMKAEQEKLAEQQNCDARTTNCPAQTATPSAQPLPPQQEQQFPGMNQYPQAIPGLEPPTEVPPTVPYAPQQPMVPGGSGTDLLRTSGSDAGLGGGQQAQAGGGAGGFSAYGEDSGDGEGGGSYQRHSYASGGMQSEGQEGFDEFGDLSLDSDFAGQGMYGNRNPYANSSGYGSGANPYSSPGFYGNASYGSSNRTNSYDLSVSNAILRENARRAREPMTPNQRLVRRSDPYREIPSLYDMYLQAAARPPAVQRFGMEVFENGTRDLQSIPMDLPVGPDYVVGPGDGLKVTVWGGVSRPFFQIVDHQGRINLPEAGPVMVAGKSLAEVQELVQKTLRTQFRDVSADVSLSRLRSIRVYVVGDVVRPGAYDVGSLSTPLNALFAAGGPTG
ncbi:MAG TPA: polysaccharide biosynthesis/export family protein, partial [Candidatus Aquilonibacter sp.]|nr:polysaccharide biosynthesis/export family protein [Candidatus Aquilonibacter sp.]